MGVLSVVRGVVASDGRTIYECRDCGTDLAKEIEECPICGSSEIAYYAL